jgi:hypothetical protein
VIIGDGRAELSREWHASYRARRAAAALPGKDRVGLAPRAASGQRQNAVQRAMKGADGTICGNGAIQQLNEHLQPLVSDV